MKYQFFYEDYVEGKSVPGSTPLDTDIPSFIHSMQCVLHSSGNFIGLIDEHGGTLQFYYNDNGSVTVDIPVPERRGSLTTDTTLDACIRIVKRLDGEPFQQQLQSLPFHRFDGKSEQSASSDQTHMPTTAKPWWKFW